MFQLTFYSSPSLLVVETWKLDIQDEDLPIELYVLNDSHNTCK